MTQVPEVSDFPGLAQALAESIPGERWFSDKHRSISRGRIAETFWIRRESPGLAVVLIDLEFTDSETARYQLVLGFRRWDNHLLTELQDGFLRLRASGGAEQEGEWAVYDAISDPGLIRELFESLAERESVAGTVGGEIRIRTLHPPLPHPWPTPSHAQSRQDHTNSTVLFGEEIFAKVLRRLWSGVSPEVELLEALDGAGFAGIAQPLAVVEVAADGETSSAAIAQRYLRNGSDGFSLALTSLRDLYSDLLLDADGAMPLPQDTIHAVEVQGGSFIGPAISMAKLTAEMHLALSRLEGGDMAPRPLKSEDLDQIATDLEALFDRLLAESNPLLEPLRVHETAIRAVAQRVRELSPSGMAIRVHGDYHLGQLLRTDAGWFALDFEGRPAVPMEARRRKTTALQDVAGMLRSFDYAATVALHQQVAGADPSRATLEPYGQAWSTVLRGHFLEAYTELVRGSRLIPEDPQAVDVILMCLEASQALYEIEYELRSRPDWLAIPLEGIARLLQRMRSDSS